MRSTGGPPLPSRSSRSDSGGTLGRSSRSDLVRQVSWIFAASQLLVLCVPLALGLVKAIAIAVIAILAIVALFFLFNERA